MMRRCVAIPVFKPNFCDGEVERSPPLCYFSPRAVWHSAAGAQVSGRFGLGPLRSTSVKAHRHYSQDAPPSGFLPSRSPELMRANAVCA